MNNNAYLIFYFVNLMVFLNIFVIGHIEFQELCLLVVRDTKVSQYIVFSIHCFGKPIDILH